MNEIDNKTREKGIYKITLTGSLVNFCLVVFKFIAGIMGHSSAMIADAIHSLSDFITDIIVLVFIHISNKPTDKSHDYGHGKYETLATALIGVILFFVGLGVLWSGGFKIYSYIKGEVLASPGIVALWAALISIVSKEVLYHYTIAEGKRLGSQAVVANAWHHRSDALSSLGTAIGIGGAIVLGEKWRVLDPIAAVIVSLFILKMAVRLIVSCIDELLEQSLPEEVEKEIEEIVTSFDGVSQPHNLCTRQIGNHYAIEMHVRMDGNIPLKEAHSVATAIEQKLKEQYGRDTHVGIHVEPLK